MKSISEIHAAAASAERRQSTFTFKYFWKMKKENKALLKGKMKQQAGYKKQAALLDETGKNQLVEIIRGGAICELRERQILDIGETITIKFYFEPAPSGAQGAKDEVWMCAECGCEISKDEYDACDGRCDDCACETSFSAE